MTFVGAIALFGAMVVLAILPGPGIVVVVARSLSGGFRDGLATSLGIVAGDFVFILVTMFGLSLLAGSLGDLFVWVRYLGAAYLIWMGFALMRRPVFNPENLTRKDAGDGTVTNYGQGFFAGLLVTLGNPKAILFYLSFFPAFLDLELVTGSVVLLVLLIALLAVGGTMVSYAYVAVKAGAALHDHRWFRHFYLLCCVLLIGSGLLLVLRS